jgi:hypothetical protein
MAKLSISLLKGNNNQGNGEVHKAAVMMFIHGGSYDTGGSSVAYYDGTNLVQVQESKVLFGRVEVWRIRKSKDIQSITNPQI